MRRWRGAWPGWRHTTSATSASARRGGERQEREAMLQEICERLDAAPVQHIGKILVVYRPGAEKPAKKPASRKGKPATKKRLGSRN